MTKIISTDAIIILLVSDIVIPHVLVLGAYFAIEVFIASFFWVSSSWSDYLRRVVVVKGRYQSHIWSYSFYH